MQGRSEIHQLVDFVEDLINVVCLDWRLASRTAHEGESDPQTGPLVLEQLDNAVGVEDVPAAQLDTWLFFELAREADVAELLTEG